jgi:hypothetical protein
MEDGSPVTVADQTKAKRVRPKRARPVNQRNGDGRKKVLQIGSTSIIPINNATLFDADSDRDEADASDDDMVNEDVDEPNVVLKRKDMKQEIQVKKAENMSDGSSEEKEKVVEEEHESPNEGKTRENDKIDVEDKQEEDGDDYVKQEGMKKEDVVKEEKDAKEASKDEKNDEGDETEERSSEEPNRVPLKQ